MQLTAANDNLDISDGDILERITEILYVGRKLLGFTQEAVKNNLLTQGEKAFIDEICGKFSDFDDDYQKYSLIDVKRIFLEILMKCEAQRSLLKEALLSQDAKISHFSEDSIYDSFRDVLQSDIANYGISSGVSDTHIRNITGDTSAITSDIIAARNGKRA